MDKIQDLLKAYIQGMIRPDQQVELDQWLAESEEHRALFRELSDPEKVSRLLRKMDGYREDAIWQKIENQQGQAAESVRYISTHKNFRWLTAASVVFLIGLTTYFLFFNQRSIRPVPEIINLTKTIDVAPGSNKAILTLANGSQIFLDSAHNGLLAKQSGSAVIKTDSGRLAYQSSKQIQSETSYNTLSTPRGGQYQLTLPDGTKVWLNAASSITYPTAFNGPNRKVTVTGEAYFEVVHNDKQPFTVSLNHTEIKDIGTHFNVNGYTDEPSMKVTLLEGAVNVKTVAASKRLSPNEQAQIQNANPSNMTVAKNINTSETVAWTRGSFDFESADLKTILRQFVRWYDVEVVYDGPVSDKKFFAVVSRNTSLKKVLELLQDNNIQYEILGKQLKIKTN